MCSESKVGHPRARVVHMTARRGVARDPSQRHGAPRVGRARAPIRPRLQRRCPRPRATSVPLNCRCGRRVRLSVEALKPEENAGGRHLPPFTHVQSPGFGAIIVVKNHRLTAPVQMARVRTSCCGGWTQSHRRLLISQLQLCQRSTVPVNPVKASTARRRFNCGHSVRVRVRVRVRNRGAPPPVGSSAPFWIHVRIVQRPTYSQPHLDWQKSGKLHSALRVRNCHSRAAMGL